MNLHFFARAASATLLAVTALETQAQDATRIVAATVYPDSARVERELKAPGGTRHVVIACLPAGVDLATLQVDGDPELRVGEIHATTLPTTRWPECTPSPLEARGQALEAKRALLEAQRDSNELALSYLRVWGASAPADDRAGTPAPAAPASKAVAKPAGTPRPGALAADLRQAAFDVLVDQARVKRELHALDQEDTRLDDEAPPSRGKDGGWRTVRFDVWTPAAATLRVHYNVINAYWRPTYRATLDTVHATLRIDRQADIVQGSGEDWGEVRVKLSTGRVNRAAQAQPPGGWFLDVVAPHPVLAGLYMSSPAPAAAPLLQRVEVTGSSIRYDRPIPPPWGASAVATDYATEFDVSQPVTLPSDGETHTLQLASQTVAATLKRRVTPRTDRAVYLLAEAPRPVGAWPSGPLQSWVDGALVGRTPWLPSQGDKLEVALGQDDQMRIDVESPGAFTQSRGVFGGSVERTSTAVYAIVNQHPQAVTVEMLDASPVSRNEAIQVRHTYAPQPSALDWDQVPGVAEWTLAIGGQQTRRVTISHTVTTSKDTQVSNLP
ncbi:MAG: DUF4139 domain-containing protein [Burkholderiaceae bacterium]